MGHTGGVSVDVVVAIAQWVVEADFHLAVVDSWCTVKCSVVLCKVLRYSSTSSSSK